MIYNFHKRLTQLFTFDKIRLYKIVEILQYTTIYSLLVIITSYLLNKYYYKLDKNINTPDNIDIKSKSNNELIKLLGIIVFEIFIITILFFYIRKIGLLIPSIPNLYSSNFKSHTTLDYIIHIGIVVFFIELLPKFKNRFEQLNILLFNH